MLRVSLLLFLICQDVSGFVHYCFPPAALTQNPSSSIRTTSTQLKALYKGEDAQEAAVIEESRMNILSSRRKQIRWTLRAAESIRNFRLSKGWVPEIDPETGKPVKSDGKAAVSFAAVVVAIGAVTLRVGGRAALISAVGLDFMTDNPDLKNQLDQVLFYAESTDLASKALLFTAAWTAVKVLCFDPAGIVLALASGILFGGVIQGALASAAAATFGSTVAFTLAKLDTPVRRKALEILDEYPSLRGIERVVAEDGLKAILTLRLAPILPIPIGMYNYIYGVTKVPIVDFCGGIFLGSLKPYLLDSYLGYFGKELVQGSTDASGFQDLILLVALGISVMIGVFASQLASETYDSVLNEVAEEKKAKREQEGEVEEKDNVTKEFFGWKLPQFMVGFQYVLKDAEASVQEMIDTELQARVWNYTEVNSNGILNVPKELDPAHQKNSPEILGANKGVDFGLSLCEGLVLSPQLFSNFLKVADPLYCPENDPDLIERISIRERFLSKEVENRRKEMLKRINHLQSKATEMIQLLDGLIQVDENTHD